MDCGAMDHSAGVNVLADLGFHRTQIIARRDGVEYVECLDCRQIFEAEDLEPVKVEDEDE